MKQFNTHRILILSILLLMSTSVFSQSTEEHPIEKKLSKCLEDSMATVPACNCMYEAQIAWDKELNKYYKLLMNGLDEPTKLALREAQRKWIVYRDKEFLYLEKYYHEFKQGTMYDIFAADRKKEIVKLRALELKNYYEELEY